MAASAAAVCSISFLTPFGPLLKRVDFAGETSGETGGLDEMAGSLIALIDGFDGIDDLSGGLGPGKKAFDVDSAIL